VPSSAASGGAGRGGDRRKGKNKAPLGALIGRPSGPGWVFDRAQKEKVDQKRRDEAMAAHQRAESKPATVADVEKARTADLNNDGFVTLDEVVAMERANLSDPRDD
jgi:hypothetical protein